MQFVELNVETGTGTRWMDDDWVARPAAKAAARMSPAAMTASATSSIRRGAVAVDGRWMAVMGPPRIPASEAVCCVDSNGRPRASNQAPTVLQPGRHGQRGQ